MPCAYLNQWIETHLLAVANQPEPVRHAAVLDGWRRDLADRLRAAVRSVGSLTEVMALSGIATAEMAMADLGLAVRLGSGVAAAQEHFRLGAAYARQKAA